MENLLTPDAAPVLIEIAKGSEDLNEFVYAKELATALHLELNTGKDIKGRILIHYERRGHRRHHDLVILGWLDNYVPSIAVESDPGGKGTFVKFPIQSFVVTVEVKNVPPSWLRLESGLLKLFSNDGKRQDNVSEQARLNRYDLLRFFESAFINQPQFNNPRISSLIWLKQGDGRIPGLENVIVGPVNGKAFFQCVACDQKEKFLSKRKLQSFAAAQKEQVFTCFEINDSAVKRMNVGYTRKRLERITKDIIQTDMQEWIKAIGTKLVVLKGAAGSGKTIKALRVAVNLSRDHDARCLFLSYNRALVFDINRLLEVIQDERVDVSVHTLDEFLIDLVLGFYILNENWATDTYIGQDYEDNKDRYISSLAVALRDGVITKEDLRNFRSSNTDWDHQYVFIDEAQDFNDDERDIIYCYFGRQNVLICEGDNQMIRQRRYTKWKQGLQKDTDYHQKIERRNLRQCSNLSMFVGSLATELKITNWEQEPSTELVGGRIIVLPRSLDFDAFKKADDDSIKSGNLPYETLFLCHKNFARQKSFLEDFKSNGFKLWDGTDYKIRKTTPRIPIDCYRIFQYSSCRGLEGWCVICLELDEFIRLQTDDERNYLENSDDIGVQRSLSIDWDVERQVGNWLMIITTRAITTLLITLKNPNSDIGRAIKRLSEKSDFIEWVE